MNKNQYIIDVHNPYPAQKALSGILNGRELLGEATEILIESSPQYIPPSCFISVKSRKESEVKAGKFTPCMYNEPDSEMIEIRYLKNVNSLDKLYQDKNNNRALTEDDIIGFRMNVGENLLSVDGLDSKFIEYMNINYFNGANTNRGINNEYPILYNVVDIQDKIDTKVKANNDRIAKAKLIQNYAGNDDLVMAHADILGLDTAIGIEYCREKLLDAVDDNITNLSSVLSNRVAQVQSILRIAYNSKKIAVIENVMTDLNTGTFTLKVEGDSIEEQIVLASNHIVNNYKLYIDYKTVEVLTQI